MLLDRLLFSDKLPKFLKKALDFKSSRHLLISSNISNMDTPGYKAKEIDFSRQLQDSAGMGDGLNMKTTHSDHIGPGPDTIKKMVPEVMEEPDAARSNGNNVNIDKEMAKLAENQIMYSAIIQIMAKRGSTIKSAVTEIAQA